MDLKEIGLIQHITYVLDTNTIFGQYDIMIQVISDVIPPFDGVVYFKNIELTILDSKLYNETTGTFIEYKLTTRKYNEKLNGTTINDLGKQLGYEVEQHGAFNFEMFNGLPIPMIVNHFISIESKKQTFDQQLLIDCENRKIICGSVKGFSSKQRMDIDKSTSYTFLNYKNFKGRYESFRGSNTIFGKGDLITPAIYGGVMLGYEFMNIVVPVELEFNHGVLYNFPDTPNVQDRYGALYSTYIVDEEKTLTFCYN